MSKFAFNSKNHLTPAEIISCTENEFRDFFIYPLETLNGTRGHRWNEYCDFISFLKKQKFRNPWHLIVFGSLVGNYKEPNDIDVFLLLSNPDTGTSDFLNSHSSGLINFLKESAKHTFNIQCVDVAPYEAWSNDPTGSMRGLDEMVTEKGTKGAIIIQY